MLNDVFYGTGLLVWVIVTLLVVLNQLIALAQTISYFAVQIAAATIHKRWSTPDLKPWLIPRDFMRTWWEFAFTGVPDRMSSKYMSWEGTFKWKVEPYKEANENTKSEN